jgi:glycosidase
MKHFKTFKFYLIVLLCLNALFAFTQSTYTTVGIIGSATASGWDASTPMEQDVDNPNLWTLDDAVLVDGELKFRANDAWDVNWGNVDFPSGTAYLNGANIPVVAGTYDITFNDETGEYSFVDENAVTYSTVGIIGSATASGWDASTPMVQDAGNPHLWTLEDVELIDGELKFRANDAWDVSWGNVDFPSGTAYLNGANVPVVAGIYDISFNDQSGAYSFTEVVTYATVGIIGSATASGWDASTPMVQDAANIHLWTLSDVELLDGELKFRANDAWDVSWGNVDFPAGTAYLNGANIPVSAGTYNISFNDKTGEYSFETQATPTYATVGIIGSATPNGWDASTPMVMNPSNPHEWTLENFVLIEGEVKFRANDSWDINWGNTQFPSGLATLNGPNINVPAGEYTITFNDQTGAYSFVEIVSYETVGIIGSATANGWDASTPMILEGSSLHDWIIYDVELTDGELKFRANDAWDVNWGNNEFPAGTAYLNGVNVPVSAGTYIVRFNDLTGAFSFETSVLYSTVGIIGSATANGWDASTPMMQDAENAHQWTLQTELVDGELKFRANDAWDVNWGGDAFPEGNAILNGANIPVAGGVYNITFNDYTSTYSFEESVVVIDPAFASGDEAITITYFANGGNAALVGASQVYAHLGVVTEGPDGTSWSYTTGNWGQDDGIGEMTAVAGETDVWELSLASLREYCNVPAEEVIFRLAVVFRNAEGTIVGKTAAEGDFYLDLDLGNYILIEEPVANELFFNATDGILFSAQTSALATRIEMFVDLGSGFESVSAVNNTNQIAYNLAGASTGTIPVRIEADIDGETIATERTFFATEYIENLSEALPAGMDLGINYNESDPTVATLVLLAPGKEFVFAVGDFSDWSALPENQMKMTPDGEYFWVELTGLEAGREYIYQYWIDGELKVADAFVDKVIDPQDDPYIPESVYPGLITHPRPEFGISTVLQTGQTPYAWNHPEPVGGYPAKEELFIYELLVRDFVESHDYKDVIDSLPYLKGLGINAIELMPVYEFMNNESWGYNNTFYFAPDKYYGTKNDLKAFIDACHAEGIVVLLDMVLNHTFEESPLFQMYQEDGEPTEDNPWYSPDCPHAPYCWGIDFDYTSSYVYDLVDKVNRYWLQEYNFDGYRFDFTKGFMISGDFNYNEERIGILTDMANDIWAHSPDAYVIFEHLADNSEETQLVDEGIMLWGNLNHSYASAIEGNASSDLNWALASTRGWNNNYLVSYMESHDEPRMMYNALEYGQIQGEYNVQNVDIALERVKLASAFYYTLPGPKMIWQFGELGYDIDINFNGRTGSKPLPWGEDGLGYYENEDRQKLYKTVSAILKLVNENNDVFEGGNFSWTPSGAGRSINISHDDMNVTIVGNFGTSSTTMTPNFQHTGTWYNYFFNTDLEVTDVSETITLNPGEFHIYTDVPVEKPEAGLVDIFTPVVEVEPGIFSENGQINLIFDANVANPVGTDGLIDADKVYMYAGVVTDSPEGTVWTNIVGSTDSDDGIGLLSPVEGEEGKWMISFNPRAYFGVDAETPMYRMAMFFRDANGENIGKARSGNDIYVDIPQAQNIVTISPEYYTTTETITITFDAAASDPSGTAGFSWCFSSLYAFWCSIERY